MQMLQFVTISIYITEERKMKKFLSVIILCVLLIGVVTSFSSCGAMTMDDVEEALVRLSEKKNLEFRYDDDEVDTEDMEEEINEVLEEKGKDLLDGRIISIYFAEEYSEDYGETMIFEFENAADAKKALSALAEIEKEDDLYRVRYGNIVFFGQKPIIKLIVNEI